MLCLVFGGVHKLHNSIRTDITPENTSKDYQWVHVAGELDLSIYLDLLVNIK